MTTQTGFPSRPLILVALGVILLSAHGLVLYLIHHYLPLSATILSGLAVIVVIKHLGAFSSLYALLRKRPRKQGTLPPEDRAQASTR